jgi:hypothetical protein
MPMILKRFFGRFSECYGKQVCFFAMVHPIIGRGRPLRRGKRRVWAVSNYFDRRKRVWKWKAEEGVAEFRGRQVTIQDYFDLLAKAGFVVERVLEPEPYPVDRMNEAELSNIPYLEAGYLKDYELWQKVPYTLIFKTRKTLTACHPANSSSQ